MMMPDSIKKNMFAPCGIDCMACYKHCNSSNPCNGCFMESKIKKRICHNCRIKACILNKSIQYCYECNQFPCKLIKKLNNKYAKQYDVDLINNSISVRDDGFESFLKMDYRWWHHEKCGGILSMQEGFCSECQTKIEDIHLGPYAYFGIINDFDEHKDYSYFSDCLSYKECLAKYHCIAIPDEIINDWWDGLITMKSYYDRFSEPNTALSRWGETLVPPESLDLLINVIKTRTNKRFLILCKAELTSLVNLLIQAKNESKFIIHFGV